ncbi:MAG: Arm DNA-binding domain-containing protein, partial [Gammaproteobacteria bacterium]
MAVNLNNDTVYRTAKPKEKDYTTSDGGGLFLFVGANGSKLWRFVYTFSGKRKKIAFGPYPDNTLETARRKAQEAREQIANGVDPSAVRKDAKA